jgi:hypothetical protein
MEAARPSDRLPTVLALVTLRRGLAMALQDTARELSDESRAVRAQARAAAARSAQLRARRERPSAHSASSTV